jgi:hypothetical protein
MKCKSGFQPKSQKLKSTIKKMKYPYSLFLLLALVFSCSNPDPLQQEYAEAPSKPRTIITTDGEVDDVDSFIRMLLYANEFTIEGLVYSASQWHYKGDGMGTLFTSQMPNTAERYGERTDLRWPGTTWMQELIGKYGEVYVNLRQHSDGFPSAEYLLDRVKVGNIAFEGEMEKDTEGSNLIKAVLLDDDPSPVYLQVWGGTNTIARALKSIEETYKETPEWTDIYRKVSAKAIIYTVLDQDATYNSYIAPSWPEIKVIYNSDQFWCFAYPWPTKVPKELQYYLSGEFFREHIINDRGPLMAAYYSWGDQRQIANDPEHDHGDPEIMAKFKMKLNDFISEGDSPAYFYLLDVGLRSLENPSFGGWGGRFVQSISNPNRWEDGTEVVDYNVYTQQLDPTFPQTRWIKEIQHDFAARASWCVKDYAEANHAPVVSLVHSENLKGKVGDKINLLAKAEDPDGDNLSFLWWHYLEAGTFKGQLVFGDKLAPTTSFVIPDEAKSGDFIHIILQVEDDGFPSLTRYQRVVVEVE